MRLLALVPPLRFLTIRGEPLNEFELAAKYVLPNMGKPLPKSLRSHKKRLTQYEPTPVTLPQRPAFSPELARAVMQPPSNAGN